MTSIFVDDPAKAFHFYTDVLGFRKKLFIPDQHLAIVVSPDDENGTSLMLEPNDNSIAKNYQTSLYDAGIPAIVFTSADVMSEYKRLSELGVVFRNEPESTRYGIEALFEDGFGNIIQLYQQ